MMAYYQEGFMVIDKDFVQEYLYIQEYPPEYYTNYENKNENKESERGVVVIDIFSDNDE